MKSFVASLSLAAALATPALATVEWDFNNGISPYSADQGSGNATITVGQFGTGWHSGTTVPWTTFGASGFWDIGRNGTMVFRGSSMTGPLSLHVLEWVATGTIGGPLGYSVSGGGSGSLSGPGVPTGGSWQEWVANINLTPGGQLTLTAPSGGALIDRVMLTVIPEPGTVLAGALLLIPFAVSTWHVLRKRRL
jgi:hypothetical protein